MKRRKDIRKGAQGYRRINQMAMRTLSSDGILVSSSCSLHLQPRQHMDLLLASARHLDRSLVMFHQGHQAADHPYSSGNSGDCLLEVIRRPGGAGLIYVGPSRFRPNCHPDRTSGGALVRPHVPGRFRCWLVAGAGSRTSIPHRVGHWRKSTICSSTSPLGIVLGGRIGYVLFYGFEGWLRDPLVLIRIWEGGMSFHGGLIGVLVAMALYGRRTGRPFFVVTDFIAPLIPPGLFFGRIGNFINGELWGRATELPWGVRFHGYGAGEVARHPSQLYEALLEGLVLFVILWWFSARPRPTMAVSGLFLLGYGLFRTFVEFFREPDDHLGFLAFDWVTMGHLLSLPMLLCGSLFLFVAYRRRG